MGVLFERGRRPSWTPLINTSIRPSHSCRSYSPSEAHQLLQTFELNYRGYLQGIAQILPPGGIGVLIFPQLHTSTHERISLNVDRLLSAFQLRICQVRANNVAFPAMFVHAWKEPIIERQIVVFKKNK